MVFMVFFFEWMNIYDVWGVAGQAYIEVCASHRFDKGMMFHI